MIVSPDSVAGVEADNTEQPSTREMANAIRARTLCITADAVSKAELPLVESKDR